MRTVVASQEVSIPEGGKSTWNRELSNCATLIQKEWHGQTWMVMYSSYCINLF